MMQEEGRWVGGTNDFWNDIIIHDRYISHMCASSMYVRSLMTAGAGD